MRVEGFIWVISKNQFTTGKESNLCLKAIFILVSFTMGKDTESDNFFSKTEINTKDLLKTTFLVDTEYSLGKTQLY